MAIPSRIEIKQQLIELLKSNGALKTSKVYELLSAQWGLTSSEEKSERGGRPLFQNEIRWARQELVIEGIIDRPFNSGRAIWQLANTTTISPEEYDDEGENYDEGSVKTISVNAYERSKKARNACLKEHGYNCVVCNFNFEKRYGDAGKNCIHVHHLVEISTIGKKYKINPTKDLVPICPNCHYLAHRRKPAYTISELQKMLMENS
ncbi:MAG: winged helix-turn-helix domain-containing protein [Oxalicibacterium faecigallinarum]|uniref:HNH endonuclease n=1 Tax=Oxalicibacterium faecigallinarum TaxID=573741 RepID=A0A8J3AYQ0_9BURK|nr:HNH endonuclease [Oxalicibacterium faecigallinarum]MDQ7969116.1 winged helix-turn-helix domain-containing protein [Oxalicibacterium faecigallinarum]GGI19734.1 hypothetical protein GCM10008066_20510 [Oxalicibacterium faecigallinarum]